jgi:hypothetical protein
MASPDPSNAQPLTPGIALAALPAPTGGDDNVMTVAMVSPAAQPAASPDGFGFEDPASTPRSSAPASGSTTMLAALIGVGMLGAGWAWRALVI